MSMIKCKECGTQISSKATVCPHCGSPNRRTSLASWIGAAMLMMLVIPACYTLVTPSDPTTYQSKPEPKPDNTPQVSVRFSATDVTITNLATEDWTVIELYLNGDPPNGWKLRASAPSIGQARKFLFSSFTAKDGRRFNPLTHQPQTLWVGGGGHDFTLYTLNQ